MTEQEQKVFNEIIDIFNQAPDDLTPYELTRISKAIIEKYPQLIKNPVIISVDKLNGHTHLECEYEIANELERYKEEHFVEVQS